MIVILRKERVNTLMRSSIFRGILILVCILGGVTMVGAENSKLMLPAQSPETVRPLLVGSAVPDLVLADLRGEPYHLRQEIANAPMVLIFYRGGW